MGSIGRKLRRAAVALAVAAAALAPAASARAADVVSRQVSFRVTNSNTSGLPCSSDGVDYTVRGHLTGPPSALVHPRVVTLYLFGYDAGEWNWRLRELPAYDFAGRMASRGHVSLTIDELGYGASDHPDGMATCMGAQADMAHQIVAKLRAGDYDAGDGRAPAFSTVVLAGHDIGGEVAEVEAYSYRDVDALIQVTWADQGHQPYIVERATVAAFDWCTRDAPSGYHHFTESAQEMRERLFNDAEPAVLAAATRLRSRNPCGMIRSAPNGVYVDRLRAGEIAVPVLVVFGDRDTLVWTREGEEQQAGNYTGSSDRTTAFVRDAGHFPMLERTAPEFRALISDWLAKRGLGGRARAPRRPALVPLPRQVVEVGASRSARVLVRCAAAHGSTCRSRLRLRTARHSHLLGKRRGVRVGGGRTRGVTVRLTRAGYELLSRHGRLRAVVVATRRARLTLVASGS